MPTSPTFQPRTLKDDSAVQLVHELAPELLISVSYGKIIPPAQIKRRLSEVKAGQIRNVAREFLRPQSMSLALVSPLKSDPGLARML